MQRNIHKILEQITEIKKSEQDKIFVEVKENQAKLNSCLMHNFTIDTTPDKPMFKKFQCTNCSGVIDAINKSWYEKGIKHNQSQVCR